jgi:hypothetical protein
MLSILKSQQSCFKLIILFLLNSALSGYALADPPDNLPNAQTPDQCNSVERPPPIATKKSLNPLCQICIGIGDELTQPYTAPNGYIGAGSSTSQKVSCQGIANGAYGSVLAQAQNDWNLMCASRGGTPGGEWNIGAACSPDGCSNTSFWTFTCQFCNGLYC